MNRETENTLLLLVGAGIGVVTVTQVFTRYVKPGLAWVLIPAAVLVVLLALAAIVGDIRRGIPRADHDHHDHDRHSHRTGIAWLLVVPVVVLMFIQPPALRPSSALAAEATGPQLRANQSARQSFPPIPPGDAPELSLPEVLMRQAQDPQDSLRNRVVTIRGFVMHTQDGVDLGRVVIICCAADAQLARISLAGPAAGQAAALPENSWVDVAGVVTSATEHGTPSLQVRHLVRIAAPANPYAYPR